MSEAEYKELLAELIPEERAGGTILPRGSRAGWEALEDATGTYGYKRRRTMTDADYDPDA